MPAPDSELEITAGLVAQLVGDQFPALLGEVTLVSHGWDSNTYRLGSSLAVRLPRTAGAVPLVANEQRWLLELAPSLPVPVPAAIAAGRPGFGYPWPWSIVPWFEGDPADRMTPALRDVAAVDLARAVIALHQPSPDDAPINTYRAVPLGDHDLRIRDQIGRLGSTADAVRAIWEDSVLAPANARKVWTHGDLHPGNALLHPNGRLVALIDFGDLSGGDPAVDLAAAWLFFTPDGREVFRDTIDSEGHYDRAVWRRAKGWAVAFSIGLISESDGSDRMTSLGFAGLRALVASTNE